MNFLQCSWNVLCQEWRNKNVKLVTYKWSEWSISCLRMTWPCKETYVASVALSWYCLSIPIEYSTDRRESVNSKSVFIYHIDYASVTSSRSVNLMVGTQKRSDLFNNYISVRHLLPGHQFENVSRQPCNQIYLVTTRAALHTKIMIYDVTLVVFILIRQGFVIARRWCVHIVIPPVNLWINFGDYR